MAETNVIGHTNAELRSNTPTQFFDGRSTATGNSLTIRAIRTDDATATAKATSGGLLSAVDVNGADSEVLLLPDLEASIGSGADVQMADDIVVRASQDSGTVTTEAEGTSFPGLTGIQLGASFSRGRAAPDVKAFVDSDSNLIAGDAVSITTASRP